MTAIQRFLDGWNDHKHPFAGVKTVDDVLRRRNVISASVH
jgi:hypothetical protein